MNEEFKNVMETTGEETQKQRMRLGNLMRYGIVGGSIF